MTERMTAAELRRMAATNRQYAAAIRRTLEESNGQRGSIRMAELHEREADRKERMAEALEVTP